MSFFCQESSFCQKKFVKNHVSLFSQKRGMVKGKNHDLILSEGRLINFTFCTFRGRNDFTKVSKNLADLKIILLGRQNNYVGPLKLVGGMSKLFAALLITLERPS